MRWRMARGEFGVVRGHAIACPPVAVRLGRLVHAEAQRRGEVGSVGVE